MKFILLKDTDEKGKEDIFRQFFLEEIMKAGLSDDCRVVQVADIGVYEKGVAVKVLPDGFTYASIEKEDISAIVQDSVKQGLPVKNKSAYIKGKQKKIVLRNCGIVDPESIESYLEHGGYRGLSRVLFDLKPEKSLEELKTSGLKGRGGGGFPVWMKWTFARNTESDEKFVICNGDEGDPGAYMDRSILEGDPHSVIEGMVAAGYIIGASRGFCYIRAEYPLAISRIQKAIEEAQEKGLLGENILGSGFDFTVEIRLGAGAFVCGEETALIASIEGKRGYPSPRPPYPSVKGLWGKPTVINNVETLANIPVVFTEGGEWFSSIGTASSTGTKVFALTGKIKNSGLVEVPMGITLREIIYDIGGGMLEGADIKAVQTGGPSGGVISKEYLDTPVDFENLQKLGSIMGSGGMIVIDERDCMVDIAKFYMSFCVDESCGKCAPCRIGTTQMQQLLNSISSGTATEKDLARLEKIAVAARKASLCGLGQTASNPVLSTLRYFGEEYMEHIRDRKCRAGKCKELLVYEIIQDRCRKCSLCFRNCPVNAISGNKKEGFIIDGEQCVKCDNCFEVCKFDAISRG